MHLVALLPVPTRSKDNRVAGGSSHDNVGLLVPSSWLPMAAEPVQWLKTTAVLHRLAGGSLALYRRLPLPVPSSS